MIINTFSKAIFENIYINLGLFKYIPIFLDLYTRKILNVSDEEYVYKKFKQVFGYEPNFKNPQTLNEIINFRKLYDKNPLYTYCSDKITVREFVKKYVGEEILIPLIGIFSHPNEINFHKIKYPCMIKTNHGSGFNIPIFQPPSWYQKIFIKNKLLYWLKLNYYFFEREWQYRNIEPKIIIEELLLDENNKIPKDYKFHCIGGKVEFIQVDVDRFSSHKRSFYSRHWKELDFTWSPVTEKGEIKYKKAPPQPKPELLNEMINIAEKLAKPFYYVRVDLYLVNNRIYFGELTFTPGAGYEKFIPDKYDRIFGQKVRNTKQFKLCFEEFLRIKKLT